MSWYKFSLSNDDVVARKSEKALELFTTLFMAHKAPKQLALFNRNDHGIVTFFLHIPDGFDTFIRAYSAVFPLSKSDKPFSDGLRFIAGHDEDRALATA